MTIAEGLQTAVDAISVGAIWALAGSGIALIYGVMRMMNFAQGEVIMVGAYALLVVAGAPWPVVVVASVGTAVVVAIAIERIAYRPVRSASEDTLLVTSFAVSACLQNLLILIAGSRPRSVSIFEGLLTPIQLGSISVDRVTLVSLGVSALLLGSLGLFLRRTLVGIQIRAASENFDMSRLLGVSANRVILYAFAISGVLAGAVALLLVARTGNLFPTIGLTPIIVGFLAVTLGGLGSLRGAILAGFLLGVVQTVLQETLPLELKPYRDAFLFGAVILVLLARPRGLLPVSHSQDRV